jgi:hypothetical protein
VNRRVAKARSSLARAHQTPNPDPDRIAELRRELGVENLAQHIARVVDELPPLTESERRRLAALLDGRTAEAVPAA